MSDQTSTTVELPEKEAIQEKLKREIAKTEEQISRIEATIASGAEEIARRESLQGESIENLKAQQTFHEWNLKQRMAVKEKLEAELEVEVQRGG